MKQGEGSYVTDAMACFQSGQRLEVSPLVGTSLCPSEDPWVSQRHFLWCDPQKTFLSVFQRNSRRAASSILSPQALRFFQTQGEQSSTTGDVESTTLNPQPSALPLWEELGTVMAPIPPFFPLKSFNGLMRHRISS